MRGNVCIDCEVEYNSDISTNKKGKVIMMGRRRDWLRAARSSGHYPLSFNFVLQKDMKFMQCSYCGTSVSNGNVTRDHTYPKSQGGMIKTPCCINCNIIKEDMRPIEFAIWYSKAGHGLATIPIGSDMGEADGEISH